MINHIVLVGRLTKKPELRYTHEGIAVSTITLAINRKFRNVEGEYDADFVNITLWRKNAENTAAYCDKGAVVGVVGRVQTRTFENNLQQRVYMTDVVADAVKFLSGKPSGSSSFDSNQQEE
ncbi:single-stranded DNA-binding protein [Priestia megaterium]|uniref:single-stranded DNA-binding protein n=1 Tax=Priestia megaterium TaxID=1404 RepID=UPI00234F140E|nr:single-stranded DNA-binding protein [Priestia megaterium]MDC7767465.1 single-stranded DNA-binding protein [Priestia megaterium]